MIRATGYMVEAELDGGVLRVHGTTTASRIALAGAEHKSGDVVIPVASIAGLQLKKAGRMVNGNLIVTTLDGRKVQMHFRRKSAAQFDALHEALSASTPGA